MNKVDNPIALAASIFKDAVPLECIPALADASVRKPASADRARWALADLAMRECLALAFDEMGFPSAANDMGRIAKIKNRKAMILAGTVLVRNAATVRLFWAATDDIKEPPMRDDIASPAAHLILQCAKITPKVWPLVIERMKVA